MANSTEQKVITAARECFFQHGYKASNMTLISEYAGFSRATVHKYTKNKEDAFRKVCQQFQEQAETACQPIMKENMECWSAINLIMQAWLKPSFDEVRDIKILNDLKYHAQVIAEDVFTSARKQMENMLCEQLEKGISKDEINLHPLSQTPRQFAQLLLASLTGLRGQFDKTHIHRASLDTLNIFKRACRAQN